MSIPFPVYPVTTPPVVQTDSPSVPIGGLDVVFPIPYTEWAAVDGTTADPNYVFFSNVTILGFHVDVLFQGAMVETPSTQTLTDINGNPFTINTIISTIPDPVAVAASIVWNATGV